MNPKDRDLPIGDILAYLVIVVPLVSFFAIVGFGDIIDQRRMSKEFHAQKAAERAAPQQMLSAVSEANR